MAYDKELLVGAYLHRFRTLDPNKVDVLERNANKFYDEAGRDKFRVYAEVTPELIREYKACL